MIRVAVAGAAGRMGQAVCAAVEGAGDLALAGQADPALGTAVVDVLEGADVLVDFTRPDQAVANAREATLAGVHVVIGTTGFSVDELRAAVAGSPGKCFWAPNFAIGAVLMMRFAAEAARHMQAAEIVEYHHPAKLDAPSGTAARTAQLMVEAGANEVPIHSVACWASSPIRRSSSAMSPRRCGSPHVTTDRTSFMPGVLLAVRRVAEIDESPLVGLEHLL